MNTSIDLERLYQIYLENPNITIDSRNCPPHSIFFGLPGERVDGRLYGRQALDNGAAYAVTEGDTLATLQQLATLHASRIDRSRTTVIGITGTNGKTTTKELTAAVLMKKSGTLYTQGNLNNHIGVPLTVLRIRPEHRFAIIEMGANHPGEIATLADIAQPDYGLITSVGKAHLEGFGSFEKVIETKSELYNYLRANGGTVFRNEDDPILSPLTEGMKSVSYPSAESFSVECNPFLKFRYNGAECQTQLIGDYNIVNVRAAIAVGTHFGVPEQDILQAIAEYTPTNNRSQFVSTERNQLVVDAYNANPTSMTAAINNFANIKTDRRKLLILGAMGELGEHSAQEHSKMCELLAKHSLLADTIFVGEQWQKPDFPDVQRLIDHLQSSPILDRLILIKGSNAQRLFKLPEHL